MSRACFYGKNTLKTRCRLSLHTMGRDGGKVWGLTGARQAESVQRVGMAFVLFSDDPASPLCYAPYE